MSHSYESTLDYLYSQLPQYQKIGGKAYKASLDNITQLCEVLENPQDKFRSIHIAGTNGKGSTSSLLASILNESGCKVGLFTSPHLIDYRERISINGKPIEKEFVTEFVTVYKDIVSDIAPSFFEWTTALGFAYFAAQKVDIAIIETGLGGRLDSSNVITPILSVITTIGLDHTQYLGNTLKSIAFEKGGIIKPTIPVVIGYGIEGEAKNELVRIAHERNSELTIAKKITKDYVCGLLGNIQYYNIATVLCVLEKLQPKLSNINESTIRKGLREVTKNTLLRGRWEVLSSSPKVIADIAHNVQAVKAIVNQLGNEKYQKLHIVWGMVEDKDIAKVVDLLPDNATYYLCQPKINRAMKLKQLATYFETKNIVLAESCQEAYNVAKSNAASEDLILVSGSNFVVSEVVEYLEF